MYEMQVQQVRAHTQGRKSTMTKKYTFCVQFHMIFAEDFRGIFTIFVKLCEEIERLAHTMLSNY